MDHFWDMRFGFQPPQPRTSVGGAFVAFVNMTTQGNFLYSADSPVRREVTDVFNGRALRVMLSKQWVEGHVVCLYEWNNGPYDFDIKWSIKIAGLGPSERTFRIHRICPGWGGTLLPTENVRDTDMSENGGVPSDLLSFEWVGGPPKGAPRARFQGDGVPCPCCRAMEPPTAWPPGEDPTEIVIEGGECPICLVASRRCVVLHCAHTVCLSCWGECRNARENVQNPHPAWEGAEGLHAGASADAEEDEEEEEEALLGGPAMNPSAERRLEAARAESRADFATQRRKGGESLNNYMRRMIESLLEDATSGVLGRARLWKKLMTLPIFCCLDVS